MAFKEILTLCFCPDEKTIRGYPLTHLLAVEISKPAGSIEVMTLFFTTDCIEITGKDLERLRDGLIKGDTTKSTYTVEKLMRHSYNA